MSLGMGNSPSHSLRRVARRLLLVREALPAAGEHVGCFRPREPVWCFVRFVGRVVRSLPLLVPLSLKLEKEESGLTDRLSFYLSVRRCAVHNEGVFAYPFLTIAPPVVRASIYTCATAGALGLFWVLNGLKSRK